MKNKPELLLPAGNPETLSCAIHYGADAVYIGGEAFSLRSKADNFDLHTMRQALLFSHSHGVKLHVAVNIFAHNDDIEKIKGYLECLSEIKPDALIISDPGVFLLAREICPDIDIHISTQLSSSNYESCMFWEGLGAKRVVLARELSLREIGKIRDRLEEEKEQKGLSERLELEAFVHGSMCISYSGRCLLSACMTGRSANRGECTHPCRWKYALMEETRPGEYFPVEEDSRGTYILNSKDLCMIEHIPKLIDAGVDAFKVEGRMKGELYVATAARAYRKAIDDYFEDPEKYKNNISLYLREIVKCTYRGFSTGFYFGRPWSEGQIYGQSSYIKNYIFLGEILDLKDDGCAVIEQKNKFSVGDNVEILEQDLEDVTVKVSGMWDEATGMSITDCPHPKERLILKLTDQSGKIYIPQKHNLLTVPALPPL